MGFNSGFKGLKVPPGFPTSTVQ